MIIARGKSDDGQQQLLLLGLSQGNIDRLREGKPIHVTRKSHGEGIPPGWAIAIVYGETEQAIVDEMREKGLLNQVDFESLPEGAE